MMREGATSGRSKINKVKQVRVARWALADLRGGARDAPPGVQILSFSCTFREQN